MNGSLNILIAWIGILLGVVSGAIVGLSFHRPNYLGGYGSWPRRLMRLGHIAFFGIGILNLAFGLTVHRLNIQNITLASVLLAVSNFLMPAVCFLAAWRGGFRKLFFVPVSCVTTSVVLLILGLLNSGCTQYLWQGALASDWEVAKIEGVVVNTQGEPVAMIVQYGRPLVICTDSRYARIPLDSNWQVLEQSTQDAQLVHRIQLDEGQRFVHVPQEMLDCDDDSRRFGYSIPTEPRVEKQPDTTPSIWLGIANAQGEIADAEPDWPLSLTVPSRRRRNWPERVFSVCGAVVLTPFTLTGDVLLISTMAITGQWL